MLGQQILKHLLRWLFAHGTKCRAFMIGQRQVNGGLLLFE